MRSMVEGATAACSYRPQVPNFISALTLIAFPSKAPLPPRCAVAGASHRRSSSTAAKGRLCPLPRFRGGGLIDTPPDRPTLKGFRGELRKELTDRLSPLGSAFRDNRASPFNLIRGIP